MKNARRNSSADVSLPAGGPLAAGLPIWAWLGLILLAVIYLAAELPYLDRFPLLNYDEGEIMAPAYHLAEAGVYGSELFTGYYGADQHVYYFMPLYPLLMGGVYRLLGAGIWQARLLPVLGGLAALMLTGILGARLHGPPAGLAAAAVLGLLRISLPSHGTGIPLLDIARVARYDSLVPIWLLLACLVLMRAHRRGSRRWYAAAGVLAGIGTLTHAYAVLILPVWFVSLVWVEGWGVVRRSAPYLLVAGWAVALLPWAAYVAQAPADYAGQMRIHSGAGRFELLDPRFYWNNLLNEGWRYAAWVGGHFSRPILWPRAGIWVLALGVTVGAVALLRRTRRRPRLSAALTLLAFPMLAGALALFEKLKIGGYQVLMLPFMALLAGYGLARAWQWGAHDRRVAQLALALLLGLAALESGYGIAANLADARRAGPYLDALQPVAERLPPGARVLATHAFWLGLEPAQVLSLNLPFYFTNPRYSNPPTALLEDALRRYEPDYILLDRIMTPAVLLPPAANEPGLADAFWRYLGQSCRLDLETTDADYGYLALYRCGG